MVNSPEHTMLQVLKFKVATLIDLDEEIAEFNTLIDDFIRDGDVQLLVRGLKKLIRKPARLQLFDDVRRVVPLRLQMDYNLVVPYTSNRTRTVRLLRRGPPATVGFGFSIRGGREHGTGFFVSAVELNSEAHLQGLRIGDQIVRINGFSVEDAIHQEVLHLIQSYNHLNLRVRSVGMIPVKDSDFSLQDDDLPVPQIPAPPPFSRIVSEPILRYMQSNDNEIHHKISVHSMDSGSSRRSSIDTVESEPVGRRRAPPLGNIGRSVSSISSMSTKKHDPLSWRMVDGKQTPRPFVRTASEASIMEGPSTFDETRDVKLFLDTTNHPSLGVSICKGTDQRPGIYVQSTREGGLAWEVGLAMGDQILECNGVNFEHITFDDAVQVLKGHKQLDLLVRKGAGLEMFGESSGYNSSTSSLNGDGGSPRDGGKRLSLITEDPEDGERSRSNSRRGADETVTIVTQHMTRTIITSDTHQEKLVKAQVHRGPDDENHALERSSSGSSVSSLSSGISHEVQRRNERREEEDRRRREIALKVVPEERRQTHAILMQEFQQAHRRMFAETERNHHNVQVQHQHDMQSRRSSSSLKSKPLVTVQTYEERLGHEVHNGDIYAVVQNGSGTRGTGKPRPAPLSVVEAEAVSAALAKPDPSRSSQQKRTGVEMTSIDTITLSSPTSPKPKPPATYFAGGKSNKSQSVVTISEYPSNERRSTPNKMEFISNGTAMHNTDDPLSALQSELQHTLSRSNLRQLSEPGTAPPPPPVIPSSPPSSPKHHHNRPLSPPMLSNDEPMTNGAHVEMRKIQPKPIQHRRPPSLINLEPPVRALKPVAEPYTELVTQKNQQLFNYNPDITVTSPPPVSPVVTSAPAVVVVPKAPEPIKSPSKATANHHPGHQLEVMDSLANKVTIKFANGESQSAGAKGLTALMASAPVTPGILKNGNHKHKTVIHQKSITFGEITTVMCVQVQDS